MSDDPTRPMRVPGPPGDVLPGEPKGLKRPVTAPLWAALLAGLAALVIGAGVGAAGKGARTENVAQTGTTSASTTAPTTTTTTLPPTTPPTTAAPVTAPRVTTPPITAAPVTAPSAPQWVRVFRFQGSGDQTTPAFTLQTGQGRIILSDTPDSNGEQTIYWYLRTVGSGSHSGSAESGRCDTNCKGYTSTFNVDPGQYYLECTTIGPWAAEVDEMR